VAGEELLVAAHVIGGADRHTRLELLDRVDEAERRLVGQQCHQRLGALVGHRSVSFSVGRPSAAARVPGWFLVAYRTVTDVTDG
jgi:hypothetical protein